MVAVLSFETTSCGVERSEHEHRKCLAPTYDTVSFERKYLFPWLALVGGWAGLGERKNMLELAEKCNTGLSREPSAH